MSAKVHLYDYTVLQYAPYFIMEEAKNQGFGGARCGYLRKNTSNKVEEVTCKICLRKLDQDIEDAKWQL